MTRVLGLVLMTATGAVAAPLALVALAGSDAALWTLGGLMAALGLLFGFLATARHLRWSIVASGVIVASIASGWVLPAPNPNEVMPPAAPTASPVRFVIPPLTLILFSVLGARILHWKAGMPRQSPED